MNVVVIGGGVSGLSTACFLAKRGYQVTLLEKNDRLGGRVASFSEKGFTFDMGPSWYWMPQIFDHFFEFFGKKTTDYYTLERLDPAYRVFFKKSSYEDIPADKQALYNLFDSIEAGSSLALKKYLYQAKIKYEKGMNNLAYKPSLHIFEFLNTALIKDLFKLDMFTSVKKHVNKHFKHEKLRKIMEFPVYFLGALPKDIPALYSLMNYADLDLGTWYPKGGMVQIVKAMQSLAEDLGVKIILNQEVCDIKVNNKNVSKVCTQNKKYITDIVVASADYHHIEQHVLKKPFRTYSKKYWDNRTMAPSSLIFFLGINKKISKLLHHNLFFDESFEDFGKTIYDSPQWPDKPLFYVNSTSKTDITAPKGCENLYILIPLASDLYDSDAKREQLFNHIIKRIEDITGEDLIKHIVVKKSFAMRDFKEKYFAYKGNAYGLANTLRQTAILKPKIKHKKINNLYYTGQLTVPGPGLPPCIISGRVVANQVIKDYSI